MVLFALLIPLALLGAVLALGRYEEVLLPGPEAEPAQAPEGAAPAR